MFSTAKKIAAPKASKKDTKAKIDIDGLANLAALDAVIKALTALKVTMEADVKSAVGAEFIQAGCALKKRPENFVGVDAAETAEGDDTFGATASCELRIRSTNSPLSEDEQKLY
ncbi:MAG: hypothetical protein EOP83_29620, partial [Verrucomicrobiaceae bacterium]